jgi:hypothetical protein
MPRLTTDTDLTALFASVRNPNLDPAADLQKNVVCQATPDRSAAYQYRTRTRFLTQFTNSLGYIEQDPSPNARWTYRPVAAMGTHVDETVHAASNEWCKVHLDHSSTPTRVFPRYAVIAGTVSPDQVIIVPGVTKHSSYPDDVDDDVPPPELVVTYIGTAAKTLGRTSGTLEARYKFVNIWGADAHSVHKVHLSIDRGVCVGPSHPSDLARGYLRDILGLTPPTGSRAWLTNAKHKELRDKFLAGSQATRFRRGSLVHVAFRPGAAPRPCVVISTDSLHAINFKDRSPRCIVMETFVAPDAQLSNPGIIILDPWSRLCTHSALIRGIRVNNDTLPSPAPIGHLATDSTPWLNLISELEKLYV